MFYGDKEAGEAELVGPDGEDDRGFRVGLWAGIWLQVSMFGTWIVGMVKDLYEVCNILCFAKRT